MHGFWHRDRGELWLEETLGFLVRALPKPPATVLEVGCGRGQIAERLAQRGYDVVAVDQDRLAVAAARRRGVDARRADFLRYRGGPYDACVFVQSLHHLAPPARAVERARSVLRPGGLLVVREQAWEAMDAPTAAWLYDTLALLRAAGLARPHALPGPKESPLAFWLREHRTGERLQMGEKMARAIRLRFERTRVDAGPYLATGPIATSLRGTRARALGRLLLETERRRIADGTLRALGLEIVAEAP